MTPDQRLRLFAALLGEGRALVLGEAGETDRTLAWARNIDAALAEYRGAVQQGEPTVAAPERCDYAPERLLSASPVIKSPGPALRAIIERDMTPVEAALNGALPAAGQQGEAKSIYAGAEYDDLCERASQQGEAKASEPACKAPDWCGDEEERAPVGVECVSDGGAYSPDYCSEECGLAADERKKLQPAEVPPGQVAGTDAMLTRLRAAGWTVAVHNDYRVDGRPMTFWLFTHQDGRWAKGEGPSDWHSLGQVEAAITRGAPAAPAKASEPAKVPLSFRMRECTPRTAQAQLWATEVAAIEVQFATAEKERDEAKGLVEVAHVANAQFYAETTAARAEVEQWKGWTAEARLERDAANERANEIGCELDGVRYEVEQLRARVEVLQPTKDADARELAMRDACAKVAREAVAYLEDIDRTEFGNGGLAKGKQILSDIERLPVGAPTDRDSRTVAGMDAAEVRAIAYAWVEKLMAHQADAIKAAVVEERERCLAWVDAFEGEENDIDVDETKAGIQSGKKLPKPYRPSGAPAPGTVPK